MGRAFSFFWRAGARAAPWWSGRSLAPLEKTRGFGMTPLFSDARYFLVPFDAVLKACSTLVDSERWERCVAQKPRANLRG
jgi:hypothetical protein